MKKHISLPLLFLLFFTTLAIPILGSNKFNIKIDNKFVNFKSSPIVENNILLVPVRDIGKALGSDVSWISANKEIIVKKGSNLIRFKINDKTSYVNNKPINLELCPKLINNRSFVPLRFLVENLGLILEWDNSTFTANIINTNIKDYYNSFYTAIKTTLNYKGKFNMKIVMDINIKNAQKMLLNINIDGIINTLNSYIQGIMSILNSNNNITIPYEVIKVNNKTYIKYDDTWNERDPSQDEQFLNIDLGIVKIINNNLISNFEKLPALKVENIKVNNLLAKRYFIDFKDNKLNTQPLDNYIFQNTNIENIDISNYKVELYMYNNQIIKELISYTVDENSKSTLYIISVDFRDIGKDIEISPPTIN